MVEILVKNCPLLFTFAANENKGTKEEGETASGMCFLLGIDKVVVFNSDFCASSTILQTLFGEVQTIRLSARSRIM